MSERAAAMSPPGTIEFADLSTGRTELWEAGSVPDAVAFVASPGGRIPVRRVTAELVDGRRLLRSYDGQGKLVTTLLAALE